MKVVTIIQARTTSSRLPNKALLDIYGKPLLERVIDQSKMIENSDELWVATSTHENDDLIEMLCNRKKVFCLRGSLEDVRGRFYEIATNQKADIIVRITADNPFTEPVYAMELIDFLKNNPDCDYVRMDKTKILDGSHSEVFTMKALEKSVKNYNDNYNEEHVTPAIIESMNLCEIIPSQNEFIAKSPYFIGVDTFTDYKKVNQIYRDLGEHNTLLQLIKKINQNGKSI